LKKIERIEVCGTGGEVNIGKRITPEQIARKSKLKLIIIMVTTSSSARAELRNPFSPQTTKATYQSSSSSSGIFEDYEYFFLFFFLTVANPLS
jgi:hypothetical protein